MNYEISQKVLQTLVAYIMTKPYNEVAVIMDTVTKEMQKFEEKIAQKEREKEKKKK